MSDKGSHDDYKSRHYPVREDMAYQIKVWRFERCGWYVLVLLVVLGFCGMFSRGPMSFRDVHGSDGKLRVQYEVFHRNGSTNPMVISVVGTPDAMVEIELSGDFLYGFSIETLLPEPGRASSVGEGIRLWLQADAQGRANLYMTLRGDGLGLFSSRVSSPGAAPVAIEQFILP
ncbi:hypothetical protein [Pseudomonas silesiensis]|uniref:hypothetical protein n=1 Tax=Pseudomonas silesiensis TaxID=1853130 RepID=UPI0034D4471D